MRIRIFPSELSLLTYAFGLEMIVCGFEMPKDINVRSHTVQTLIGTNVSFPIAEYNAGLTTHCLREKRTLGLSHKRWEQAEASRGERMTKSSFLILAAISLQGLSCWLTCLRNFPCLLSDEAHTEQVELARILCHSCQVLQGQDVVWSILAIQQVLVKGQPELLRSSHGLSRENLCSGSPSINPLTARRI